MVTQLAAAQIAPTGCPLPLSEDCNVANCWACHYALERVVDWGNAHLQGPWGPVAKRSIRNFLRERPDAWNIIRRGLARQAPQPSQVARSALEPAAALDMTCAICMEGCDDAHFVLSCRHAYHLACLVDLLRHDRRCPVCRGPVDF